MKQGAALAGVQKLRPIRGGSDHALYKVYCNGCGQFVGKTWFSNRTAGTDLSDGLISTMARELRVARSFFNELVRCTRDRNDYLAEVGHRH
jgi:hypothetical protein